MILTNISISDVVQIPIEWVAIAIGAMATALGVVFKLYLSSQKNLLREKEEKYRILVTLRSRAREKRRNDPDVSL
jgi:hypothetical protein